MSDTLVKSAVCDACGADVRDESLFCYNCGERVREEQATNDVASDVHASKEPVIAQMPGSRPPLRSAASLRKQRRAYNRQPIEVSWEPASRSSIVFVVSTVILAVGALILLALALYLR